MLHISNQTESIAQKLIDAAWKWVASWQDWESRSEIDVCGPKETFKQLAQEVEEIVRQAYLCEDKIKAGMIADINHYRKREKEMKKTLAQEIYKVISIQTKREKLWRELDELHKNTIIVANGSDNGYLVAQHYQQIQKLRKELGLA